MATDQVNFSFLELSGMGVTETKQAIKLSRQLVLRERILLLKLCQQRNDQRLLSSDVEALCLLERGQNIRMLRGSRWERRSLFVCSFWLTSGHAVTPMSPLGQLLGEDSVMQARQAPPAFTDHRSSILTHSVVYYSLTR